MSAPFRKTRSFLLCCICLCCCIAPSRGQTDAQSLRQLAERVMYLDESHIDSFLFYANFIETEAQKLNYPRGLCDSYRLRGIYHECRSEHDQSIEWHLKNLALSERIGDAESQLSALSDLAIQYHYLKQFEEAKNYLHQAIRLGEQVQTKPKRISSFYMNLGVFHRESGQLDSALYYYDKALALKRQIADSVGVINVMVNMGTLLVLQKKYLQAQPFVKTCLDYHLLHRDTINLWFDYFNQSQISLGAGQMAPAERYLDAALKLAEAIQSNQKILDTYGQYVLLYEAQGNLPKALEMMRRYQSLNASIINVETNRNVAELREKYESDRREQQNQLLSLDVQRQKSQKQSLVAFTLLVALLGGAAGWAWWKNRQKSRLLSQKNNELEAEKRKLENTLNRLHEMRNQLMHSEKMASIGQLTAGIAHEINNPINFVGTSVQAIKMNLADLKQLLPENLRNHPELAALYAENETLMAGIERGMDRTRDIILGLRTFSRNEEGEFTAVDLHACIDSALALIVHETKNHCVVQKSYGDIPHIQGLPGKINQVMLNLLTNAVQAIQAVHPPGAEPAGLIEIETRQSGNQVVVAIRDNGIGMDEATQQRMFEPFFTTKPVGEGTGLGMAICYGIIRQHHGEITVKSAPGQGTTIKVTFG